MGWFSKVFGGGASSVIKDITSFSLLGIPIDAATKKKNKTEDSIGGNIGETGTGAVTDEEAKETTKSRLFRLGLFFTSPLGLGAAGKSSRARLT